MVPLHQALGGLTCALGSALLAAGCAAAAPAHTFHVAQTGQDTQPGTADAPFATLERARDAVRALRAAGPLPAGGVAVMVHAGAWERATTFALTAEDSGTAAAPVVWRAAPGETVRLVGGRAVPATAFQPVDGAVRERLDPAARDRVRQADLTPLGLTDLGTFPNRYRGVPAVPEVFCNDQRLNLAQWPNEGWTTIARIVEAGSVPRNGDNTNRPGSFEYSGDRPARWDVTAGVWLQGYWCFDWYEEVIKVKSIDPVGKLITLAEPHLYSVKQGNPSPRRYKALNVLEELDAPGEYFLDRATRRLYVWLPDDPATARVVLSTLNAPIVSLTDCQHVTLRGFIVEAGLGHGVEVTAGTDVRVEACEVRNVRQLGLNVQGGTAHRVEACEVHHTGTGGVTLAGGDRRALTPAGHVAHNNHIHHFAIQQLTYANGLTLAGVGQTATHNLLHDAPHQAVSVSGNDHVFEFNEVHHVCTETDDCGALYKGRNPSSRGNVVRHNFWHHIGSPMGHGNAAVYFDDGDGGEVVFGNVFYRCGDPGKGNFGTVFSHGGHDNLAENNVFIECRRAIGSSPWNDQRWAAALKAADWQTKLLQEVDITKPPYTTRYPALVGYLTPAAGTPRVNRATRNVFVMSGEVSSGNWQWQPAENLVLSEDPGFVDALHGDFRLRPDSLVFGRLPGFQPILFEQMGLVVDALRLVRPTRAWTPEPLRQVAPPERRTPAPAAPAPPRTGPPPVLQAPRAARPPAVDGQLDPTEWPADRAVPVAENLDGTKAARPSRAWVTHDGATLYVAVENPVVAGTDLTGHTWGQHDAVEVSLRPGGPESKAPIYVLRGYGNGRLDYGTAAAGNVEPRTADPGDIRYQAKVLSPERWVAEFAVPFRMVDLDPAGPRAAFNVTVRKTRDNAWVMWASTRGNSYDVGRAGLLELGQ